MKLLDRFFKKKTNHPKVVHFELTTHCNLRCIMCKGSSDVIKEEHADLEIYKKLLPFASKAENVGLFGWGEPLTHPNIKEVIKLSGKYIKDGKPHFAFTTNGLLLTDEIIELIVDNQFYDVTVSIDSPNKDTYESIRTGANFDKVINNIKKLQECKKKKESKLPIVSIEFVAMKRNIEQLPELIKLAKELGADRVIVVHLVLYYIQKKMDQNESLFFHQGLSNKMFNEAEMTAKEEDIKLDLPPKFGSQQNKEGFCNEPFDYFYVDNKGRVMPCCRLRGTVLGDLNKEVPEKIWTGKKFNQFRQNLTDNKLTQFCKNCHKYTGTDPNNKSTYLKGKELITNDMKNLINENNTDIRRNN